MDAAELATVVEGWATLAGLMVVIAGALFAGIQLRQEAKSRHLQVLVTVFENIRSRDVVGAWRTVLGLPDGFVLKDISEGEREAAFLVFNAYGRLGMLLALGAVNERDIFPDPALSRQSIEVWEKVKTSLRQPRPDRGPLQEAIPNAIYLEQLAAQAQDYLLLHGAKRFGAIRVFDADWNALTALGQRVDEARASGRG